MNIRPVVRKVVLISTIMLLIIISWITLSGGFNQLGRSATTGQQAETAIQIACGLLSILCSVTCFYFRNWSRFVRTAWTISLAATAGMSSLVWGPPMLIPGLVFASLASLVALVIIRLLKIGGA